MVDPVFTALRLDDLTPRQLHAVLRLRAAVFVVEQKCAYQDPDAVDLVAWHLLMTEERPDGPVIAYARWWDEDDGAHVGMRCGARVGMRCSARVGRVLTAADVRGRGLGHLLVAECLRRIGPRRVVLHAQDHLRRFYEAHGFAAAGDVFLEDDIPHVEMVRESE